VTAKKRKEAPTEAPKSPPEKPRKGGPEARAAALLLLSEGFTVTYAAAEVGVRINTVRAWRDSDEGRRVLAAAREKKADALAGSVGSARQLLEDNALRAAHTIVDNLESPAPSVRNAAARTLLDRVGVPAVREVLMQAAAGPDLSKLTADELADLERLLEKAGAP
jgi:hypothetical protein